MTSPDVQRHSIDTYAAANGISIVDWVEGIDESGSRARSAWWARLDQAITRMEAGEFDTIIVWKFSRTARNRLRWATAVDRVDTVGGNLISATEPVDNHTASGRFARGMLGELNAYQAELIGEGWKETLERRVRDGLPGTGRPRFGYTLDRTYTPDPALAPVVREMYRRAIAGNGMASITRWLNDHGHRTRNGLEWQTAGVTRYLDRGFAAGLIWSKGTFHPGAHEPIIDPATWEAYLARRASTTRPPRGSVRMLSGLLKCAGCGGPMMAVRSTGGQGNYGCARRPRGGHCPTPVHITRELAEREVAAWVLALPEQTALLTEAADRAKRDRLTSIEDRAAIEKLILRAENRLSNLTIKLLDEKISQAAYDATEAKVNDDLKGLRLRYAQAAPIPESNLLLEVPRLVEGWKDSTPALQNRIARALIDRVIVHRADAPARLDIIPRWATRK